MEIHTLNRGSVKTIVLPKGVLIMPKIVNPEYKAFNREGIINPIELDAFEDILKRVKHPTNTTQARALFILLYYSGRRPCELIELKPENIDKEGRFIIIRFITKKGGRATTLAFPKNKHLLEVYDYCKKCIPDTHVFYNFMSETKNKVCWKTKAGQPHFKEYSRPSKRINYWVNKWAKRPAYFFRHNRMSLLAMKGATDRELMFFKGAKDQKSIQPYIHLSKAASQKLAKYFK